MIISISDVTYPARRWRFLVITGVFALTALAVQLSGINYQFQILVAAIFIPLMFLGYVRSTRERMGDIKPLWMEAATPSVGERRQNPSGPLENPFDFASSAPTLDERITALADVCRQFGRRASVIHFQFHVSDGATLERAASVLRGRIRRTDLIESVGEKEIVICLNMIRDLGEVGLVMRRLSASLEQNRIDRADWEVGYAMYPIHGYTGADMIAYARHIGASAGDERTSEARKIQIEPSQLPSAEILARHHFESAEAMAGVVVMRKPVPDEQSLAGPG
jgi:hypothetical protein